MRQLALDVVVTRGASIESRHRVHAAVVGPGDTVIAVAREPSLVAMWRSCSKLFQVLPLLSSGGFDAVGWGEEELALACASHGGEPEHIAIADRMLQSIGREEGDLACGPHEPLSARGAKLARESGRPFSRLMNNCSGKHAGMLARATTAGWPTHGYERADHSVQRSCLAEVATWSGVPIDDMPIGVDGCGVTVMALPVTAMALAYSRWGQAVEVGDDLPARTATAIRANPFVFGGTDRFDTVMIEETGGRVISKVGAEGVHSITVPGRGLGIAVKVEDGALRAQHIAVIRALQLLDVLPETLTPRLAEWALKPIRNTRGEIVGEVRSAQ
jgi:L-asparaginase II